VDAPGRILFPLPGGNHGAHSAVALGFSPDQLTAELEPVVLDDERLERIWGKQVTRIVLRPTQPARTGQWTLRWTLVP
jgi:hypothetical protein